MLEFKVEHQENYASFWDFDVKIENGIFVYIFFDKRNKSQFFIMWVPYLLSTTPFTVLKGSILLEHLGITRCTLRLNDIILRASEFSSKIIVKDGNSTALTKQLRKTFNRYPVFFQKFGKTHVFLLKYIK